MKKMNESQGWKKPLSAQSRTEHRCWVDLAAMSSDLTVGHGLMWLLLRGGDLR